MRVWSGVRSLCPVSLPARFLAIVDILEYHDVVRAAVLERGWSSVADSLVLHSVVALLGAAGFLLVAYRRREFHALGSVLQWLALGGCWATVISGFALCMMLTWHKTGEADPVNPLTEYALENLDLGHKVILDAATGAGEWTAQWAAEVAEQGGTSRIISIDHDLPDEWRTKVLDRLGDLRRFVELRIEDIFEMGGIEDSSVDIVNCHDTLVFLGTRSFEPRPGPAEETITEWREIMTEEISRLPWDEALRQSLDGQIAQVAEQVLSKGTLLNPPIFVMKARLCGSPPR